MASLGIRPFADLADALWTRARRNGARPEELDLIDRPLSGADVAEHVAAVAAGHELVPLYDAGSLDWLLERLAMDPRNGTLRARAVLRGKKLVGWYIYYACPGGFSPSRKRSQLIAPVRWRERPTGAIAATNAALFC